MSKLDELIYMLCPDGVELRKMGEIVEYEQPGKYIVADVNYDDSYATPVLTAGQSFVLGFTNEAEGVYPASKENPVIIFDDFTGSFKWVDFPFKVKSSAMKMLKPNGSEATLRYVFHLMGKLNISSTEHKRLWIGMYSELMVPVPPLEVQREIVRVLDTFESLIADLSEELKNRNLQFSGISTELFDRVKKENTEKMLSDCCMIVKGTTPIQKAISGEYPLVVTTSERKTSSSYQFDAEAVCIPLVSSRGHGVASLNHVYYQSGRFALGNILCALIPREPANVMAKYLYYYFEQTKEYTLVPLMKGGANVALHVSDIEKIWVPIPPVDDQRKIVKQLETVDEYCNTLLRAEIEARRQQYEYYRDKLLTFKEKSIG